MPAIDALFAETISARARQDVIASMGEMSVDARSAAGREERPARHRRRLVEETTLPQRALTALTRANIYFVEQLAGMTRNELLMHKGIGRKCLADIEEYLSCQGISLQSETGLRNLPAWTEPSSAEVLAA